MQYIDLAYLQGLMPLQKIIECCDDMMLGRLDPAALANLDACELSAISDIHLHCRGLYTLPFSPVPAEVRELTAQLTKCYLYMRRAAEVTPEPVLSLYKRQMDKLKAITENTFRIDTGNDPSVAAQGPRVTETKKRFPQGFLGDLLDEG